MIRRVLQSLNYFKNSLKMAEAARVLGKQDAAGTDSSSKDAQSSTENGKRQNEDGTPDANAAKKAKFDAAPPMQGRADRKRKVALLLAYTGEGYHGLQINRGVPTIEEDLIKALVEKEFIPEDHGKEPQKMSFQRAARTDKGVSAAGQVVSLKMLLDRDVINDLNSALPTQIRALGYKRTTKSFNSKNHCTGRTYLYMTPTYAFAPVDVNVTEEYRIDRSILERVQEILNCFKGTHNFHNFTSGVKATEASANRYIMDFQCGEPFVQDGMEFVVLTVFGQSFMIHQIRKMVGLTIAIVRGYCGRDVITKAYQEQKVDIPVAPGTGLLLDQVHYEGYNKKFGSDGMHEPVVWDDCKDQMEQFKKEHIFPYIIKAEKAENVMLKWLSTLHFHNYDVREDGELPNFAMKRRLDKANRERRASESGGSDGESSSTPAETKAGDTEGKETVIGQQEDDSSSSQSQTTGSQPVAADAPASTQDKAS